MAPPSRLRPHLNDLLQKNHDLEHTVADLRHQLTESSAKWADERKTLAMGCDALMASFAKFRARFDTDWSEIDEDRQSEDEGDGARKLDDGERPEKDGDRLETEDGHEKCNALISKLRAQVEQLEGAQRNARAVEEELGSFKETHDTITAQLQARIDELQDSLSTAMDDNARSNPDSPPRQAPTDETQTTREEIEVLRSELASAKEQIVASEEEVTRLKELLLQWKRYGNDWKREAGHSHSRVVEFESRESELTARLKILEGDHNLLEKERKETKRLAKALAEQVATTDHHKIACKEAEKRVSELEVQVNRLLEQTQDPAQSGSIQQTYNSPERIEQASQTQDPPQEQETSNTDSEKRNEMIVLRIPFRSQRSISTNGHPSGSAQTLDDRTSASTPANSSLNHYTGPSFDATAYQVCIHTCNPFRCRDGSGSFMWSRKRSALPRHALSLKKHPNCSSECPGHRLLSTPGAAQEPRGVKCRMPTEEEITLAMEEARTTGRGRLEVQEEQDEDEDLNEEEREVDGELGQEANGNATNRQEDDEPQEEIGKVASSSSERTSDTPLGKRKRLRGDDELDELPKSRSRRLRPRPSQLR